METTLEDFEGVEDITGALSVLREIEKVEVACKSDKPLSEYGEIVCSKL